MSYTWECWWKNHPNVVQNIVGESSWSRLKLLGAKHPTLLNLKIVKKNMSQLYSGYTASTALLERLSHHVYNILLTFHIQIAVVEYSNKAGFRENFKRVWPYLCSLHCCTMRTNHTCWVTEDKAPAACWDKVILWTLRLHIDKQKETHTMHTKEWSLLYHEWAK